jgi:hypothetical protein
MTNRTLTRRNLLLAAIASFSVTTITAQQPPNLAAYLMPDRAAEIALARSAAPKYIADSATVLVLTRSGYVEAARGSNGFVCYVQRSFYKPVGDPGFWDPANLGPLCLNPPAVRTVQAEFRKRGEWIMTGVSPSEIAKRTKQAYAAHTFPMPAAGAMAYMLSHEQHLADENPHWVPHLMFWFDKSLPAAAWGLGDANSAIIDGTANDPSSPLRLLLVPVRRWSDGKPALPDGA